MVSDTTLQQQNPPPDTRTAFAFDAELIGQPSANTDFSSIITNANAEKKDVRDLTLSETGAEKEEEAKKRAVLQQSINQTLDQQIFDLKEQIADLNIKIAEQQLHLDEANETYNNTMEEDAKANEKWGELNEQYAEIEQQLAEAQAAGNTEEANRLEKMLEAKKPQVDQAGDDTIDAIERSFKDMEAASDARDKVKASQKELEDKEAQLQETIEQKNEQNGVTVSANKTQTTTTPITAADEGRKSIKTDVQATDSFKVAANGQTPDAVPQVAREIVAENNNTFSLG